MNRLLQLGFTPVGHWSLVENGIQFNLDNNHRSTNVLYSFISNGEVKYIGKTTRQLSARMYGYKNPGPTQSTNIRVNNLISTLLLEENTVDIFILVDNGLLSYGGYRINLAAGLEDTLINEITPQWNYRGIDRVPEDANSIDVDLIQVPANGQNIHPQFQVTLGNTYLNQGFFNVGKEYSTLFAEDNAIIEIQIGEDPDRVIQGYINRRANSNYTPRIMGGYQLTDWLQNSFILNDSLTVEVLSPVSIKLT